MKKLTINTNNNHAAAAVTEGGDNSTHTAELSNGSLSPLPTKLSVSSLVEHQTIHVTIWVIVYVMGWD